jgi:hypothetical protein
VAKLSAEVIYGPSVFSHSFALAPHLEFKHYIVVSVYCVLSEYVTIVMAQLHYKAELFTLLAVCTAKDVVMIQRVCAAIAAAAPADTVSQMCHFDFLLDEVFGVTEQLV